MKTITANDLLGLPLKERLQLVEDLWDTIAAVPEALELSEARRQELDARLAAYHQDPTAGSLWEEVKKRITFAVQ